MNELTIRKQFCDTSFGRTAYIEAGPADAPPVLFVHGIPTSSYLWRNVLRMLQDKYRCIAPDLMGLGDTEVASSVKSLDMDAQAEMLLEFMDRLGHPAFDLVCHDQGGAAAQILATRQPDRVTSLVLTDCVCYDNWPVPAVARLQALSALPVLGDLFSRTGLAQWLETSTPLSNFRRGVFTPDRLSDDTIAEYLRPLRSGPQARENFKQFLLAGHKRYTEVVVADLRALQTPTLVVWAADDAYLSPSWGKRLFEEIPGAERFELVPFCGHFWQEERPAEFAAHIGRFLAKQVKARAVVATAEEAA